MNWDLNRPYGQDFDIRQKIEKVQRELDDLAAVVPFLVRFSEGGGFGAEGDIRVRSVTYVGASTGAFKLIAPASGVSPVYTLPPLPTVSGHLLSSTTEGVMNYVPAATGTVTGSGTPNNVPMWDGGGTGLLDCSPIITTDGVSNVTVSGDFVPFSAGAYNFGGSGLEWLRVYVSTIITGNIAAPSGLLELSKITTYDSIVTEGKGIVPIHDIVELTNQGANIGATNMTNSAAIGLYRVGYNLRTTTADAGAGSLVVTVAYNDGFARSVVSAMILLTSTAQFTQGFVAVSNASGGNITYATTVTGMYLTSKYALDVTLERIA